MAPLGLAGWLAPLVTLAASAAHAVAERTAALRASAERRLHARAARLDAQLRFKAVRLDAELEALRARLAALREGDRPGRRPDPPTGRSGG